MQDAEPRAAKTASLEAKFKLLALLPYDRRAKRKHSLVFGFILDWYHSKYGDALASVRHVTTTIKERDPDGEGIRIGDVHAALTDLVAWGYLDQQKGVGRRASRYVPVWAKLNSVRENRNTTDDGISVRENRNTSVREKRNTTGDSVRENCNEDPSTVTRPQDGVNGKMDNECAAPTAPLSVGLAATDAVAAQDLKQDLFDELWHAYGRNRQKKEARGAYAKLSPSRELHAKIVESARNWRKAWEAQNKPDAPRYSLARWIEREDYECEPPTACKVKERKAPQAAPKETKSDRKPPQERSMRIVDITGVEWEEISTTHSVFRFSFTERDKPETWTHEININHPKQEVQIEAQKEFARLTRALGVGDVEDEEQLKALSRRPITVMPRFEGGLDYAPAPKANYQLVDELDDEDDDFAEAA